LLVSFHCSTSFLILVTQSIGKYILMKAYIFFLFGFACLLVCSCSREIDYEFDYPGDQIAVSAIIDPSIGLEARLTQTFLPGAYRNQAELWIDDADLRLVSDRGEEFVANALGEGRYTIAKEVIEDFSGQFRLLATHDRLPDITSGWVAVPEAVRQPSLMRTLPDNPGQQSIPSATHTFNAIDPPGNTYFFIEIYPNNVPEHQFQLTAESNIDLEVCEFYNYHPPYGIFFPDVCVTDAAFSISLSSRWNRRVYEFGEELFFEEYSVAIRTIDENYFSLLLDRLNLDSIDGTVVEARPSTDNIENGVGVFLGRNSFVVSYQRP